MKMSKMIVNTLREVPSHIESTSLQLLIRSGMVKKVQSGYYAYMPMGFRVLDKIQKLMERKLGGHFQKMLLPNTAVSSKDLFIQLVRSDIKFNKELSVGLFSIRPNMISDKDIKQKTFRTPEIIQVEAITLCGSEEERSSNIENVQNLIEEIFKQCGLIVRKSDDELSDEDELSRKKVFAPSKAGRHAFAYCNSCNYSATLQSAVYFEDQDENIIDKPLEEIYTPSVKTISDLEQYLEVSQKKLLKCLIFKAKDKFVATLLRGDRELNFRKLENLLQITPDELEFASGEDVEKITGAITGFAGPVGLKGVSVIADREAVKVKNAVSGANKTDYHLRNVNYSRDYTVDMIADIGLINSGDKCRLCNEIISFDNGIELCHIENISQTTETGSTVFVGHYLIDVTEIVAAVVEQHHDSHGIIWPMSISPYQAIITIVNVNDKTQIDLASCLYNDLVSSEIDVLLDDRDERAGIKFKDADLIGIPIRIVVGKKANEGVVEYKKRGHEAVEMGYNEIKGKILKELEYNCN